MKKKDLKTRKDVFNLVSRFYKKVRVNPEIGHFFNEIIQDCDEHLEKLTKFWESHLSRKSHKSAYRSGPT